MGRGRGSPPSSHGISAASVSALAQEGVGREPRQRRQEVGLLVREEAACPDSGVSGFWAHQPSLWPGESTHCGFSSLLMGLTGGYRGELHNEPSA